MKTFLLAVALLLVACPPEPRPLPLTGPLDGGLPPYIPDAEPVPNVPEALSCARMCEQMQKLGCPIGQPTPGRHEPCLSWCTRIQGKHEIDLHPDCLAQVQSCANIRSCDN
jgi:hypothetical protein